MTNLPVPSYTVYASGSNAPWDAIRRIDVAGCAKLIRSQLNREYPGVKFSVKSKRYAGGSSIDITYPAELTADEIKHVKTVTEAFQSKSFDGMIDLAYSWSSWLLRDGSALPAYCRGTVESGGYAPAFDNPNPGDAELVSFGSDYVFITKKWN